MKIKNTIWNKSIRKKFLNIITSLELFLSLILIFIDIPNKYKVTTGIVFAIILIIIYIVIWIFSNTMKEIKFDINNSKIEIRVGDLFQEKGLKVIPFNEFFDTTVDEDLISENTLNGKFVKENIQDLEKFNIEIEELLKQRNKEGTIVENRLKGKNKKYKLGTVIKYSNEYLLVAFSKFDSNNEAKLTMEEYISSLLEFWREVSRIYAQNNIIVPILGSGITRFNGYNVTEQENLEILLWTLKISKIKIAVPSKIVIVINKKLLEKINLYKIKEEYSNGI